MYSPALRLMLKEQYQFKAIVTNRHALIEEVYKPLSVAPTMQATSNKLERICTTSHTFDFPSRKKGALGGVVFIQSGIQISPITSKTEPLAITRTSGGMVVPGTVGADTPRTGPNTKLSTGFLHLVGRKGASRSRIGRREQLSE